jgi:hypothetical protein
MTLIEQKYWEFKQLLDAIALDTFCFGYHKVVNTEMEFAGMYFWGIGIGKDCLEAYAKLTNTCRIITLSAVAETGNSFYIFYRE